MSVINEEIDNVEVRMMQRPRDKSLYLEIRVRSEIRPTLKKIGTLEKINDHRKEAQRVASLAGAMAEMLCEQYHDTLEPSAVARAALEAYTEMMAEQRGFLVGYEERASDDKRVVVPPGELH